MASTTHTTTNLTVGIIIVSTSAAKNPSTDESGEKLRSFFKYANESLGSARWEVIKTEIVSDIIEQIQNAIKILTDEIKCNLIVTTGGTGFSESDCTPEAVKPLINKEACGLVHAMLSLSLKITPFAMMSRPVAGVRKQSIIVTVPGSPNGAVENLGALIKLLPHACIQASGSTASRKLHTGGVEALEQQHGVKVHEGHNQIGDLQVADVFQVHDHHYNHHHHHSHRDQHHNSKDGHKIPKSRTTPEQRMNALNTAVTLRHRESPYPMVSVDEATGFVSNNTCLQTVLTVPVDSLLVSHVLAHDVQAPEAVPAFRASVVDGYAVYHTDGPGIYPVVSVSHAAPGMVPALQPGQITRITTGAPLPAGATAVVMVEDTVIASTSPDGTEETTVNILASGLKDGENVREAGSDVAQGSTVLRAGTLISSHGGEIGLLASVGIATVPVYRKPSVAILSTGNELVPHNAEGTGGLHIGQIRDSNAPTLHAAITAAGFPAISFGIAPDTPDGLGNLLQKALAEHDVVVTTGGVSMGELDLLKPTIERVLGGTIHFGRVAMKPGKPATFATVGQKQVFALPGNPASTLVTFHLFVLPALRKAAGYNPWLLPRFPVIAGNDFRLDPRPEFHRVFVGTEAGGRDLIAMSTGGQRSSRIGSTVAANGVVCLPARDKTEVGEKRAQVGVIPKGEYLDAILWGQIRGIPSL